MPTMIQPSVPATMHYLKAIEAIDRMKRRR